MRNDIRPLRIGLTGNIGSGKSTAASLFAEMNVPVINADIVGHQILEHDENVKKKIVGKFGADVLVDGIIDRKRIAHIVFNSPTKKTDLEKILHPAIMESIDAELANIGEKHYAIIEAALIYEAELSDRFDYIILVKAEKNLSIERASTGLGISRKEAVERLNTQIPQLEKEKLADFVIANNGTVEDLKKKVELLHSVISSLPKGSAGDD